MIEFNDIEINRFQLNTLLNHQEKRSFKYLLENGVYCNKCKDVCNDGVSNYKLFLERFNDIKIVGKCAKCNNEVTRIMEFGENESFFRKAMQFRNTYNLYVGS